MISQVGGRRGGDLNYEIMNYNGFSDRDLVNRCYDIICKNCNSSMRQKILIFLLLASVIISYITVGKLLCKK